MNKNLTPAATVLVLRDSKEGIEVLMVKRSKKSPFGNLYVFPGGKIDEDDLQKEWKSYCDGYNAVCYTHLRAHETKARLVCRRLL